MSLLGKLLSLATLLSAFSLGCQAQGVNPYRLPKLGSILLGNSWAIADCAGDGKADIVTSSLGQLDLQFGRGVQQESAIAVSGGQSGTSLFAFDVDGDRDIDIVITNSRSQELIGVWINDGTGRFTAGDVSAVRNDFASLAASSFDLPDHPVARITLPAQQQRTADALRVSLRSEALADNPTSLGPRCFHSVRSHEAGLTGWRGPPLAS
jgi:hypothetical protein